MAASAPRIGWIGAGRMGLPMAELLLKAGQEEPAGTRTGARAEPVKQLGARLVRAAAALAALDVLFSMVSRGKALEEFFFGPAGVISGKGKVPAIFVDCSTIGVE